MRIVYFFEIVFVATADILSDVADLFRGQVAVTARPLRLPLLHGPEQLGVIGECVDDRQPPAFPFVGVLEHLDDDVYVRHEGPSRPSDSYFLVGYGDFIIAIAFFVLIKVFTLKVLSKRSDYGKLSEIICFIGSLTFGIYMLHVPINYILAGKFYKLVEPLFGTFITSLIWVCVNMFVGGYVTFLLKKLPVFKELL